MPRPRAPKPTATALEHWQRLLQTPPEGGRAYPSERALARQWELSISAINRATHRLIAQGLLRREGYRLYPGTIGKTVPPSRSLPVVHAVIHENNAISALLAEEASRQGLPLIPHRYISREGYLSALADLRKRPPSALVLDRPEIAQTPMGDVAALMRSGTAVVFCCEAPAGFHAVCEDARGEVRVALRHLHDLGHREVALLASFPGMAGHPLQIAAYHELCAALDLRSSADRVVWHAPGRDPILRVISRNQLQLKGVTAYLCLSAGDASRFLRELRAAGVRVPQDLSFVAVGSAPQQTGAPKLASVSADQRWIARTCLQEALQLHREMSGGSTPASCIRVRLESSLRDASSTAAPPGTRASASTAPRLELPEDRGYSLQPRWPEDRAERSRLAAATWDNAYPLARAADATAFAPLDLSEWVNRTHDQTNCWVAGYPLKHFSPGRKQIHGVPFQFGMGTRGGGRNLIMMRSLLQRTGGGQELPAQVQIPVGRRVRGVYLLHACGWARNRERVATYRFVPARGRTVELPVVAAGWAPPGSGGAEGPEPNIQDWWYSLPQFNTEHARHCVLTQDGDPLLYERYLYTLEWVNPAPALPLREIQVVAETDSPAVLGILAVTLLL